MGVHTSKHDAVAHPESSMPLYFFDIKDQDRFSEDDIGIECEPREDVRDAVIEALPDFARDLRLENSDNTITVTVRDEAGKIVFHASLTLNAGWLDDSGPPPPVDRV